MAIIEAPRDNGRRAPLLSRRSATLNEVVFDVQVAGRGSRGIRRTGWASPAAWVGEFFRHWRCHRDPRRQMKPQPAQLSACDAAELAARYVHALIGWWLPGAKAPACRPEDTQRDAERRWEEEGGNLSR